LIIFLQNIGSLCLLDWSVIIHINAIRIIIFGVGVGVVFERIHIFSVNEACRLMLIVFVFDCGY
jgi:hypothetical protein